MLLKLVLLLTLMLLLLLLLAMKLVLMLVVVVVVVLLLLLGRMNHLRQRLRLWRRSVVRGKMLVRHWLLLLLGR